MKFRRRNYLINKDFQFKVILIFITVALIGSFVAVALFNYFALKELESQMWSIHINAQSTGEFLKPLFLKVNVASFIFISLLLSIFAFWIVKKISGPLYRMSTDIRKASSGDLTTEIILRERDDFRDLAEDLNSMIKNLRVNIQDIYNKYAEISRQLAKFNEGDINKDDYNELLSRIESIEENINRFKVK